ncbi:hypothetical protein QUB60_16480 [Microcoleus sp. A2-C5]|uniref:hypothetical protein n=1 Tax=unclassified Microcoleus TaxID=2642155 RepID=UPI002FCF82D2
MKFGISAVAVADWSLLKIRSTKNSIKQIYLIKRKISIAKKIAVYIFFRLPSSVFLLPSSVFRLPSSVFRLPSSFFLLPST